MAKVKTKNTSAIEMEGRYEQARRWLVANPRVSEVELKICQKWDITRRQARSYIKEARRRMVVERLPESLDRANENYSESIERMREVGYEAFRGGDYKTALAAAKYDSEICGAQRAYLLAVEGKSFTDEELVAAAVGEVCANLERLTPEQRAQLVAAIGGAR